MSHKYEHVSTGNGFWVSNPDGSGRIQVINQDGTLNGSTPIDDSSVTNAKLKVPKMEIYQETFSYDDMTDGGGTSGTFELSTTIPAGSTLLSSQITGITGFTGDTSAVITLGDGSDVDRYNTGTPNVFVTAVAGVDMGSPSGTTWHDADKTPTVTITSAADFSSVSAGEATITITFVRPV